MKKNLDTIIDPRISLKMKFSESINTAISQL